MKERGGLLGRTDPPSMKESHPRKGLLHAFQRNRGLTKSKTNVLAVQQDEVTNLTAFPPILVSVDRRKTNQIGNTDIPYHQPSIASHGTVTPNGCSPRFSEFECSPGTAPTVATTFEDESYSSSCGHRINVLNPRHISHAFDTKVLSDRNSPTNELLRHSSHVNASTFPSARGDISLLPLNLAYGAGAANDALPVGMSSDSFPASLTPSATRSVPLGMMAQNSSTERARPVTSAAALARAIDARVNSDPASYTNDLLRLSSSSMTGRKERSQRELCGTQASQQSYTVNHQHAATKQSQELDIMKRIMDISVHESVPCDRRSVPAASIHSNDYASTPHNHRGLPSSEDSVYTASSSVSSCTWQSSSPRPGRCTLQPPHPCSNASISYSDHYLYQRQAPNNGRIAAAGRIPTPPHRSLHGRNNSNNEDIHHPAMFRSRGNGSPADESRSFACDDDEASAIFEQEKEMIELAIERSMQEMSIQQCKVQPLEQSRPHEEEARVSIHSTAYHSHLAGDLRKPPPRPVATADTALQHKERIESHSWQSPNRSGCLKSDEGDEIDEDAMYDRLEQELLERAMELSLAESQRF